MSALQDARAAQLIRDDVEAYLASHERKSLLRFITCGSVDDGKSTLIGRLLYESKLLYEDQIAALERDSKTMGAVQDGLDFALLVDGLAAEREQGITIDVAYRFFSTERRKFIVADTPGHEQYTRNMATGASTADLAVVIVDARKGVLPQTKRHSAIVSLVGVKRIVLAVNKMDLVGFDARIFDDIRAKYEVVADRLGLASVDAIPLSALAGDNVVASSDRTPWYGGPSLLEHLETVVVSGAEDEPFAMPIQWVARPDQSFRGFAGTIASGSVRAGDRVRSLPAGRETRIERIVAMSDDATEAHVGQAVMLTLADEIDASRGDLLAAADAPPECSDQFQASLIWMDDAPMLPGRPYAFKLGTLSGSAQIIELKHKLDVEKLIDAPAKILTLNEIGVVKLTLDRETAFRTYADNRTLGGFILIDKVTNRTVAAGFIDYALRRAGNIHRQALDVDPAARARIKGHRPAVLWFTGLSGSGKSTIANALERKLNALGAHTVLLDGDNVRHGLNRDLGFTDADRVENIRRVAEVAALMADAGLITLVSFISPFRAERALAKERVGAARFWEIYVDTPLAVAEQRDAKGLYAKARAGLIANFTGVDSPYEPPTDPAIRLQTVDATAEAAADAVLSRLRADEVIGF